MTTIEGKGQLSAHINPLVPGVSYMLHVAFLVP